MRGALEMMEECCKVFTQSRDDRLCNAIGIRATKIQAKVYRSRACALHCVKVSKSARINENDKLRESTKTAYHLPISPSLLQQLGMCSSLNYSRAFTKTTLSHNKYQICLLNGSQPVSNHDNRHGFLPRQPLCSPPACNSPRS